MALAAMEIRLEDVARVYVGRRGGCMCGCRGTYSTSAKQIKKVYDLLMSKLDRTDWEYEPGEYLYWQDPLTGKVYAAYLR